jgi:hypothetical protein
MAREDTLVDTAVLVLVEAAELCFGDTHVGQKYQVDVKRGDQDEIPA